MWLANLEETIVACRQALAEEDLAEVGRLLRNAGVTDEELASLVARIANREFDASGWSRLAGVCAKGGIQEQSWRLQRYVLLRVGLQRLARVSDLPVVDEVKQRLYGHLQFIARPDPEDAAILNPQGSGFQGLCAYVLQEKFSAGQLDWVVSGFARSWLLKIPLRDVPRFIYGVYRRAGGPKPYFVPHTPIRRELPILTEEDERRAMRVIAASMALQPDIRAFLSSSWWLDPQLAAVSPHMAWLARWMEECRRFGALITILGPAPPNSGYLVGDHRRRAMYESGQWKPVNGILFWPRRDLLSWLKDQGG
jgi:hypothetical protein